MVPSTSPQTVTVQYPGGQVTGRDYGDFHTFYSVPYSSLTSDFADPQVLNDAGDIGALKPEARDVALTITRPAGIAAGKDAPVVVFIHGGRYESGHHDSPGHRGDSFAQSGCVYVSLGYRLRFEGFAHIGDQLPGQYRGVSDCLIGLEWIQRNIESFGGDPTNVTLIGQSAGAAIALWLARRDHYRGAFRRVIALSPGFPRQGLAQRMLGLRLAAARRHPATALPRLSAAQRARTYQRFRTFYLDDMAVGPFPFDPSELAEVPIIVSSTREEMYLEPTGSLLDRSGLGKLAIRSHGRRLGCTDTERYIAALSDQDPRRMFGRLLGDSTIRRWVSATAEHARGPVWMLEFTGTAGLPANHCVDLPLMFHNLTVNEERVTELLGPNAVAKKTELADHVHNLVVSIARGAQPPWEQYTAATRTCYQVCLNGELGLSKDPLALVRETFPAIPPT